MIKLLIKYNKCTVYRVVNYDLYNSDERQKNDQQNDQQQSIDIVAIEGFSDQQSDHQATTERPSSDHQATTQEERENRKERKKDINSDIPYEDILEAYNQICCSLPKVRSLSTNRRNKIKSRWKELKDLNKFKEIFAKAENSSFLIGNNKNNWKCSFDWLMENDNNYVKVIEGQYDRDSSNNANDWLKEE